MPLGFSNGKYQIRFSKLNGNEDQIVEIERPNIAEEKFADGDKIMHPSFGDGIVVERRGDLITIAFTEKKYGIKKFAANIAPLEKITN